MLLILADDSMGAAKKNKLQSGFTILEVLIALGTLSILTAVLLPSWNRFLEKWRVAEAQSQIYAALRTTLNTALKNRTVWQFSIRETPSGKIEWAIHPQKENPAAWQSLGSHSLNIDPADTTLHQKNSAYYIKFDFKGRLASSTRTLTLTSSIAPSIKRCIIMSTALGTMRQSQEQPKPNSRGRYCY